MSSAKSEKQPSEKQSSEKQSGAKKSRAKKGRMKVPLPIPWRNSSWVNSFGGKGASPLKYQEVGPGFILRQLLLLIEKGKFVDASQLLNKVDIDTLKDIIQDIPMEPVIESIPQALIMLESLYSRLFISNVDVFPVELFQVEVMVLHIVRYLSMIQSTMEYKYPTPMDAKKSIVNILRIVLHVNPDLVRTLYKRKKLMDTALQGIGEHGLIEYNGSLVSLHDALKLEVGRSINMYKGMVHSMEDMSLSQSKPIKMKITSRERKSSHGNHQELTKLNENQIQTRLFKNKSLLDAIESKFNTKLSDLIKTLQERVEYDKSALLAFGKLKSEIKTFSSQTKVVPLISQYSNSLDTVLKMFKELLDEHCESEHSSYSTIGYHSDEEDMISLPGLTAEEDVTKTAVVKTEIESVEKATSSQSVVIGQESPVPKPTEISNQQNSNGIGGNQPKPGVMNVPWWKRHKRSRSLDIPISSASTDKQDSKQQGSPRQRSSSIDQSTVISRPRKQSVDDSKELQKMLSRIRDMSASSPAVGRRQLERRGISQPRSRDSSISPSVLRKHFFGGGGGVGGGGGRGGATPSISSQTEHEVKDDDPDPMYATLKLQTPPANSGSTQAQVNQHCSREREEELLKENRRLQEELYKVTMELQMMKTAQGRKTVDERTSLPDSKEDVSTDTISDSDQELSQEGHQESVPPTRPAPDLPPPRTQAFIEQQVVVLEKQRSESLREAGIVMSTESKRDQVFRINKPTKSLALSERLHISFDILNEPEDISNQDETSSQNTDSIDKAAMLVNTSMNELQPAAIQQDSPDTRPRSASLVDQSTPINPPQQTAATAVPTSPVTSEQEPRETHTNRHLPRNRMRHLPGELLYDYDKLYSELRAVAWTALPIEPEDKDSVLFFVIVFAFRSTQTTIHELHMAKARMQVLPNDDEDSIASYAMDIPPDNKSQVELLQHLRQMGDTFDLTPMITDVLQQLFELSQPHQVLRTTTHLTKFVTSCVRLAWKLSIQTSPYVIDHELRTFDPAVHQRAPSSNRKNNKIKEHIWPALVESNAGVCVYKGVVLT